MCAPVLALPRLQRCMSTRDPESPVRRSPTGQEQSRRGRRGALQPVGGSGFPADLEAWLCLSPPLSIPCFPPSSAGVWSLPRPSHIRSKTRPPSRPRHAPLPVGGETILTSRPLDRVICQLVIAAKVTAGESGESAPSVKVQTAWQPSPHVSKGGSLHSAGETPSTHARSRSY